MTYEQVSNGMKYQWKFKATGYSILLFPVKGVNNHSQVVQARQELRRDFLCDHVDVEWITDDVNETLEVGQKVFA